jgi:putative transposase
MGNHVHLLIRPHEEEDLSSIMRWLLGNFARAYNKKRGWTGHFWGDRFHSRVLNGIRDFAIAFEYIDENPVKAGLVALPIEWRHSGAWYSLRHGGFCHEPMPLWLALLAAFRKLPLGIV